MNQRIIGILGGMGPEATWDLFGRIIHATPAEKDADHFRVIIDSNPAIPDRTQAILGKGPSPVRAMIATGKNLERAGAHFLAIPCMTAHYFLHDVASSLNIHVIDALALLRDHLNHRQPGQRIGLIATTGSLQTSLFEQYIEKDRFILPSPEIQENEVMDLIYGTDGIKAGGRSREILDRLRHVVQLMKHQEASAVIAGCTEIGLIMKDQSMPLPVVDPLDLLAREAIRLASVD